MANNASLSGILNANDLATDAANFGGAAANVRFDEYVVTVDQDGASVTLEIDNAALVIDAPDLKTGVEFAQPIALPAGTKSLRVIVGQTIAGDANYKLTARTSLGNVALASLGVASTQQPSTGQTVSLAGILDTGDLLVPVNATTDYSLADEYVVKPNISGNVTIEISGATGTGFTPNLQLIDAAGVITNVAGASTTQLFSANSATRVRVLNNAAALGTDASAQYNIAFAATTGSLTVTPIAAISGSGQIEQNTQPCPPLPPRNLRIPPPTCATTKANRESLVPTIRPHRLTTLTVSPSPPATTRSTSAASPPTSPAFSPTCKPVSTLTARTTPMPAGLSVSMATTPSLEPPTMTHR
ncbi:MAG: hypothetical protein HC795_14745 [Coleofasciculaceae cyanobacterium RL_1_1]|nr:hypothetical protein [Coleofasciculaceae cyanobacterium RL_1_1]